MADFKKLSDVEVVLEPTETANVLIEEDGVIKKTSISSLVNYLVNAKLEEIENGTY